MTAPCTIACDAFARNASPHNDVVTLREVRGRQERPHFEHQHELKSGSDTHAVQRVTVNRLTKEAPKIHDVTGSGEKIEMIRAAAVGLRSSFCQLQKTCFFDSLDTHRRAR